MFQSLSQYNQVGYFHRVSSPLHYQQMRSDWDQFGHIPKHWISKENGRVSATALFDEDNSYSLQLGQPHILRVHFKEGYKIFDGNNKEHIQLWAQWEGQGKANPWENELNEWQEPLKSRLERGFYLPFPSHKHFYEEHKFGYAIGYSDYISAVILLEHSVQAANFLTLPKEKS